MIINCGNRRLVSYRYGWKIEIQHLSKKTGAVRWREDAPAYPATLAQACEMLAERILTDGPDLAIADLPGALKSAAHRVREYMEKARVSP